MGGRIFSFDQPQGRPAAAGAKNFENSLLTSNHSVTIIEKSNALENAENKKSFVQLIALKSVTMELARPVSWGEGQGREERGMEIKRLNTAQVQALLPLVWEVFLEDEAADNPEDGKRAFWNAIHDPEYARVTEESRRKVLSALAECCEKISWDLGYRPE